MLSLMWGCKRRPRTIGIVLAGIVVGGCHSRVPVATPGAIPPRQASIAPSELRAGDRVRVTLRSGATETFTIAEARSDSLVAEDGRRFSYADIRWIEEVRLSKARTIALVAAMPFIMLVLVGLTYHGP